jgi:hypothetical protein
MAHVLNRGSSYAPISTKALGQSACVRDTHVEIAELKVWVAGVEDPLEHSKRSAVDGSWFTSCNVFYLWPEVPGQERSSLALQESFWSCRGHLEGLA